MKYRIRVPKVGLAIVLLAAGSAQAQTLAQNPCAERLVVELTPDVPRPRDEGFLSSLLSNHPEYRLTLVREDDPTTLVVDLIGPGPKESCQAVVRTMRKDGRVISVHPESDELPSVAVRADVETSTPQPDTRAVRTGLGSLFWSAAHPANAWKILMPVQPGDAAGVYEDVRVACLEKQPSTDEVTICP